MLHNAVRVNRWKTTVDPTTAVHFARHIVQGTTVVLPAEATPNARELAAHINACTTSGAQFVTVNQDTYAAGLVEFTATAKGSAFNYAINQPTYGAGLTEFGTAAKDSAFDYAVDLWRFTYGDCTHAAVSLVHQIPHHNLVAHRTAYGRAFGNHLIAASQDVSPLAIYTATRREYDADKTWATNIGVFLLDPATLPQYGQWCLDVGDITHVMDVRTLRGPGLDDEYWARTELGRDINFDTAWPNGVVHCVYNFTAR